MGSLRKFVSLTGLMGSLASTPFIGTSVYMVRTVSLVAIGSMALAGCEDQKSLEWQMKHLQDSNALTRQKAIDGLGQTNRNMESGKEEDKKKFRDKAIEGIAKAYMSDALKEASKDRKKLLDILSNMNDTRAKPAFLHAIRNYKPGDTDEETKNVLRTVVRMKKDFMNDQDLGKALIELLKKVKMSDKGGKEIAVLLADSLTGLKPTSIKTDALSILATANDGQPTLANQELAVKQALAASVLGEIGDKEIVPQLIDLMFELGSKMIKIKDATTAEEIEKGSPITSNIAMLIGNALTKIGEPAIAPLMPYVKDDASNEQVKKVKEKFDKFIGPDGSGGKNLYVTMATKTIVNIGLPQVSKEVASIVRDPKTKETDRKSLVTLLVSLPADKDTVEAVKEAYKLAQAGSLKVGILTSASRMMDVSLADWLIEQAKLLKKDDDADARTAALGSAEWLVTKSNIDALEALFTEYKIADKPDPVWTTKVATDKECDPKGKDKEKCGEHPDLKTADGKAHKIVYYDDKTPKHSEVLKLLKDLLGKCEDKAACYFAEFKDAAKIVDKGGMTKVTREMTESMIRAQKSAWMLSAFGKEDDMAALVKHVPHVSHFQLRGFVQTAVDKNLHNGSEKVADVITKLVKSERDKGSETALGLAGQLEPMAAKLRARAASSGAKK